MEPACADAHWRRRLRGDKWLDLRGGHASRGADERPRLAARLLARAATGLESVARPGYFILTRANLIATSGGVGGEASSASARRTPTARADVAAAAKAAGADLRVDPPRLPPSSHRLRRRSARPLTVGIFFWLDGDLHARVSLACDAIVEKLTQSMTLRRVLAYLQTYVDKKVGKYSGEASTPTRRVLTRRRGVAKLCFHRRTHLPSGAEGRHVHDGLVASPPDMGKIRKWKPALQTKEKGTATKSNPQLAESWASMTQGNKNAGTIAAESASMAPATLRPTSSSTPRRGGGDGGSAGPRPAEQGEGAQYQVISDTSKIKP